MFMEKRLSSLIHKMAEIGFILPVLADVIEGQMSVGGIVLDKMMFRRPPFGVYYNLKENRLYVDPVHVEAIFQDMWLSRALTNVKGLVGRGDSDIKKLSKSKLGNVLGAILYHGIHVYSRINRGALLNDEFSKRWYNEMFYRSIYFGTDQLTTISRASAVMWTYPYMKLVLELFELPMYHNAVFSKRDVQRIVGILNNYNKTNILPMMSKANIDQPGIDAYNEWFRVFCEELTTCFFNQSYRIPMLDDYFFEKNNFKVLNMNVLKYPYSANSTVDVMAYRFPAPIFRELFVTSEPLSQTIFATFVDGKLNNYPDWQKVCARGLSLLD